MTGLRKILNPFLMILLQFSAESHQVPYMFAAEGEDVTLPCYNLEPGQERCKLTTWIHEIIDTKTDVKLIDFGEVGTNVSERVNLTKECSLLLYNVKAGEAGRYTSRQYSTWGHDTRSSIMSLSIVSLKKVTNSLQTEFHCFVSTNLRCTNVKVKWLVDDAPVTMTTHPHKRLNKSNRCSSVHLHQAHSSLGQNFTCEVTHGDLKYQYHPKEERPVEITLTPLMIIETLTTPWTDKHNKETTQEEQSRNGDSNESGDSEDRTESARWWCAVLATAVVLLIAVVIFVTWRKVRMKPREPVSSPSVEEEMSYASVSFNKSHKKTVIRPNEENVIYSPVRSAASVDSAQLYASVNKNK